MLSCIVIVLTIVLYSICPFLLLSLFILVIFIIVFIWNTLEMYGYTKESDSVPPAGSFPRGHNSVQIWKQGSSSYSWGMNNEKITICSKWIKHRDSRRIIGFYSGKHGFGDFILSCKCDAESQSFRNINEGWWFTNSGTKTIISIFSKTVCAALAIMLIWV